MWGADTQRSGSSALVMPTFPMAKFKSGSASNSSFLECAPQKAKQFNRVLPMRETQMAFRAPGFALAQS